MTKPTEAQLPLAADEIKVIAEFARFVDKNSVARARVKNSLSLSEVVLIAHFYGFTEITEKILLTATNLLISTDWVWQKFGRRWSDHLFALSLLSLSDEGLIHRVSHLGTPQQGAIEKDCSHEIEASTFYEYAKITKDVQEELRLSTTIEEVVEVARSHGFYFRKVDILMRKHEWRDEFFPWGNMSMQEVREFMHTPPAYA
jgi:hypothetical protein